MFGDWYFSLYCSTLIDITEFYCLRNCFCKSWSSYQPSRRVKLSGTEQIYLLNSELDVVKGGFRKLEFSFTLSFFFLFQSMFNAHTLHAFTEYLVAFCPLTEEKPIQVHFLFFLKCMFWFSYLRIKCVQNVLQRVTKILLGFLQPLLKKLHIWPLWSMQLISLKLSVMWTAETAPGAA